MKPLITFIQSLYSWIEKYVSLQKSVSLQSQTEEDTTNKSKEDQIKELKVAQKQAQKKAELEGNFVQRHTDIAEDCFNIPTYCFYITVVNNNCSIFTDWLGVSLIFLMP